jgi:ribosome biogenesis GTPase
MQDTQSGALRAIGWNHHCAARLAALSPAPGSLPVRITSIQGDWLTVHDGTHAHAARALPRLLSSLAAHDDMLAVGDWVLVEPLHGEHWLAERLDPVTQIARRANDGRRQVLASNIDTALLVMGLDLDFNMRRLERYIAVARSAGISPVVVLTKADLVADPDEMIWQVSRRIPRIPVLAANGTDPEHVAQLQPWLAAGQTLCLLGASGSGKSTLTNTLTGAVQQTGGVRKGDGRGKHTTTVRSLHQCADGACIVDTPGLRSWRPDADEETLSATFDDIALLARSCQFRDCRHEDEPGCAVKAAVDADRLANYHKLLRDARRGEMTPLDRIAERSKWKTLNKSVRTRMREKQGR